MLNKINLEEYQGKYVYIDGHIYSIKDELDSIKTLYKDERVFGTVPEPVFWWSDFWNHIKITAEVKGYRGMLGEINQESIEFIKMKVSIINWIESLDEVNNNYVKDENLEIVIDEEE